MRRSKGFYRFHIENRKGRYRLMIGTAGDTKNDYSYLDKTYFAILCPQAGATHFTAAAAQLALQDLKTLINSHPLYAYPE